MPFVLRPGGTRRGWVVWCVLLVVAAAAGAAGHHAYWTQQLGDLRQQASALKNLHQLEQNQERAGLQLRVAEARSQELERQVDALNKALRESQDEVTFFRKSRGTRPATGRSSTGE